MKRANTHTNTYFRYDGPPLDANYPPHCFEISTADTRYYVGENLDWYTGGQAGAAGRDAPSVAKLPRREAGMGLVSARKWLDALQTALLPPPVPHQMQPDTEGEALIFSQLFQVNKSLRTFGICWHR
jgi:hypothetical protein